MWSQRKSRFLTLQTQDDDEKKKDSDSTIQKSPPPRYTDLDAVLYVVTLCAAGTVVSLGSQLPLERVLGYNFVLGWFATDLLWCASNVFVSFRSAGDYLSYILSVGASALLWWQLKKITLFLAANLVAAVLLALYWVLTESVLDAAHWTQRGAVRVLGLYGFVTVLALIVCYTNSLEFTLHPWYVGFVLNALATLKREVNWYNRAAHGYTWGVLVYELGKGTLVFSEFFYYAEKVSDLP